MRTGCARIEHEPQLRAGAVSNPDVRAAVTVPIDRANDVLPQGVSKGPSLLRLLTHLGVDSRRCLVAGDTLNDLSMLELGMPSVAVGNSEAGLLDRVAGLDHVHAARGHGAAGIAEAILAFKFFDKNAA